MVLVKIVMEIDPLSMRGSLVMTMAMISPPGGMFPRQNSSAGALDWFCPGSALRQRRFAQKAPLLFFPGQNTPYSRRWAPEACQGAHKVGGRALHPCGWLVAPLWYFLRPIFFIYSKNMLREGSGLFEL